MAASTSSTKYRTLTDAIPARFLRVTVVAKRIYEPKADDDGYRVLVDRLWPRGLAKAAAGID